MTQRRHRTVRNGMKSLLGNDSYKGVNYGIIRLNIRHSIDIHVLCGVYGWIFIWEICEMTATFMLYSIVLYLIGVLIGFMWGRSRK